MKGMEQPRNDVARARAPRRRERGATMVEYAIALAFVAVAFIAGARVLGDAISNSFTGHQESVTEEMSGGGG
jgi:Flp pilus assembly pilin Flp